MKKNEPAENEIWKAELFATAMTFAAAGAVVGLARLIQWLTH